MIYIYFILLQFSSNKDPKLIFSGPLMVPALNINSKYTLIYSILTGSEEVPRL